MTPKCEECRWDGCTESISIRQEESKLSSNKFVVFPQTYSNKLTSKRVCSALRWKGYVYKRRKLHRNSHVLLSEENATAISNGSSGHHLQKAVIDLKSHIQSVPNSEGTSICSVIKDGESEKLFICEDKYAPECFSSINETSSSLKPNVGHGSTSTMIAAEDSGECFSFDVVVEPLRKFNSVEELCIFVLRSHGLFGGEWTSTGCTSLDFLPDNDNKLSHSCKICRLSENPVKMLICDLCEEAFHMSCCKPKVKKLPAYEWHCQFCFKKKPKTLQEKRTGKSFGIIKGRKRISPKESLVSLMLKDTRPYTSRLRIGQDFQAEVPDWSGPIYDVAFSFEIREEMQSKRLSSATISILMNGPSRSKSTEQYGGMQHPDGLKEGVRTAAPSSQNC